MKAVIVHSGSQLATLDNQDTLVQVEEVAALLQASQIETSVLAFRDSFDELKRSIQNLAPDFIFNLVETVGGTDELLYLVAGYFEYLKIPYTGCSAATLAFMSSKRRQKELMLLAGIATPPLLNSNVDMFSMSEWIVKSDSEHASLGIGPDNVVKTASEAKARIEEKKLKFGGDWFAERYVAGREFNISILSDERGGFEVLAPAEIIFTNYPEARPKIVDYEAKWDATSVVYNATPRRFDFPVVDQGLLNDMKKISCLCWESFNLKGAARVDFRVDLQGKPWVLEVNPNPCLAADAGFMAAALQSQLSPKDVVKRLLPINLL